MCDLLSTCVKNEPSIKFVTDFWDNPRIKETTNWQINQLTSFYALNLYELYNASANNVVLFTVKGLIPN
jgi:hypothetical protein